MAHYVNPGFQSYDHFSAFPSDSMVHRVALETLLLRILWARNPMKDVGFDDFSTRRIVFVFILFCDQNPDRFLDIFVIWDIFMNTAPYGILAKSDPKAGLVSKIWLINLFVEVLKAIQHSLTMYIHRDETVLIDRKWDVLTIGSTFHFRRLLPDWSKEINDTQLVADIPVFALSDRIKDLRSQLSLHHDTLIGNL